MPNQVDVEALAARITERLAVLGMTERKASMLATGQPDAIRYIRTRRSMPSLQRLYQIAKALEIDPAYLLGQVDTNDYASAKHEVELASLMSPATLSKYKSLQKDDESAPIIDCRIVGHELFKKTDGSFLNASVCEMYSHIIGIIRTPKYDDDCEGFAIYCPDDSLSPAFEINSLMLFEVQADPRPRDYVLVEFIDRKNPTEKRAFLKRFIGRTHEYITLEQFNPPAVFQLPLDRVELLHRFIPYGELLEMR